MDWFKSKYEKELDGIIQRIEMNMSNNYKDNAKEGLRELEQSLNKLKEDGSLKSKSVKRYEDILATYQQRMQKGYGHTEQKTGR